MELKIERNSSDQKIKSKNDSTALNKEKLISTVYSYSDIINIYKSKLFVNNKMTIKSNFDHKGTKKFLSSKNKALEKFYLDDEIKQPEIQKEEKSPIKIKFKVKTRELKSTDILKDKNKIKSDINDSKINFGDNFCNNFKIKSNKSNKFVINKRRSRKCFANLLDSIDENYDFVPQIKKSRRQSVMTIKRINIENNKESDININKNIKNSKNKKLKEIKKSENESFVISEDSSFMQILEEI